MEHYCNKLSLYAHCLKNQYEQDNTICLISLHDILYRIKKHHINYKANDPNKMEIGHIQNNEDIINNIINVIDMQKSLFYDCSDIIIPQVLMLIKLLCERNNINYETIEYEYFKNRSPYFFIEIAQYSIDNEHLIEENIDYFIDCCLMGMSAYKAWELLCLNNSEK